MSLTHALESAPAVEGRRRAGQFGRSVLACVAGAAALNWVANPWQLYPTRLVTPRTLDLRVNKLDLLRRHGAGSEQLVLGSSRMMRFEPARLEARTGLRTFNLAVPGATPADSLALYRCAAETVGAPVRSVVLGVEAHSFIDAERSYYPLRHHPDLAPFLPPRALPPVDLYGLGQLLSGGQTRDSLAAVGRKVGLGRPRRLRCVLGADGLEMGGGEAEPQVGPEAEAARRRADEVWRGARPRPPDERTFRDLRALLLLLRARGVRTTLVATPMLDELRAHWRATGFLANEAVGLRRARALAEDAGARFVDFSRPASFGGGRAEFYDSVHPTARATRRMIDRLFPEERRASGRALQ